MDPFLLDLFLNNKKNSIYKLLIIYSLLEEC